MRRLRQQQRLAAGFLLACVVVGLLGEWKRREIFPFYSWFLFSMVPTEVAGYDVLLREVGGHTYAPPASYRRTTEGFRNPHSIDAYRTVQDLGRAVDTGDRAQAERLRRAFESRFSVWPVHYDLVRVVSDNPLDHWKTGQPPRNDPLASFSVVRPAP